MIELIRRRRAQMLVHSCIYYHLNQNIISDHQWQAWADELAALQKANPDLEVGYYDEEFKDWTGASGAFLPISDPEIVAKAQQILRLHDQYTLANGTGRHKEHKENNTLEDFMT